MTIYTSNYFKYKGPRGVDISVSKPKWANVEREIKQLKPSWEWVSKWNEVKDLPDTDYKKMEVMEEYTLYYRNKLSKIGIAEILNLLRDGDVLLCWCWGFCHRHILAEFLRENGVTVIEI